MLYFPLLLLLLARKEKPKMAPEKNIFIIPHLVYRSPLSQRDVNFHNNKACISACLPAIPFTRKSPHFALQSTGINRKVFYVKNFPFFFSRFLFPPTEFYCFHRKLSPETVYRTFSVAGKKSQLFTRFILRFSSTLWAKFTKWEIFRLISGYREKVFFRPWFETIVQRETFKRSLLALTE